jgi:hypothetical protein
MNTMVLTHGWYLALGLAAIVWVAATLRRRGLTFLARRWEGELPLVASWNHLLTVGVYLLHVGCLLLALPYGGRASNPIEVIELVSTKIGVVLLCLAVTLFLHLKAYWTLHRGLPVAKLSP